jgi:hypothetical protein
MGSATDENESHNQGRRRSPLTSRPAVIGMHAGHRRAWAHEFRSWILLSDLRRNASTCAAKFAETEVAVSDLRRMPRCSASANASQ